MLLTEASTASQRYQARIARFENAHADAHRRWSVLANVRLLLFVLLAVAAWQWYPNRSLFTGSLALLTVLVLIPAIVLHRRLRARRDHLARLVDVNRRGRDRAALAWNAAIPSSPAAEPSTDHPYARDLNIVGHESIIRRIGTPITLSGWRALQRWLLEPARLEKIDQRQQAVQELGALIELRQDVEQAGLNLESDPDGLEALLTWAEDRSVLAGRQWMVVLAWIGPLAAAMLGIAQVLGVITLPLWVLALAVNLVLSQLIGGGVVADAHRVGRVSETLRGYRAIGEILEPHRLRAPLLASIHSALFGDGGAGSVRRLARATSFIIPRGSLLYIPLQLAFCWDIHVAAALDRWKAKSGQRLRYWLATIGEWEALAALSVLAWDHPDWAMPDVSGGHDRIDATALRHPLLGEQLAVANDTVVGPAGSFLFVTGSNMSGKSTLLRAIGANVVLAQAGAPVAASRMILPLVDVITTMRVEDSLAHGVSFFLAELQRLKQVIDAADAASARPVLYLLDEILQGTNTAERQIASRRVLRHLTTTNALGAVSSHDLTLIQDSGMEHTAVPVHFSEQFHEGAGETAMTFDYRLCPGLATSSNALKLMELLGFPEE